MRTLLILALCLATTLSIPLFKNPSSCGKVATNGRCAAAGAGGRCSWGYCSPWSWCGTSALHKNRSQTKYNARKGCYTASYWNTKRDQWEAAEAKKREAARAAQLKKDQAAAAAHAKAAAAAKKAHDAAKAKAEKEKADIAANKAKHDQIQLLLKKQMEALLAKIAAAKKAAAAQLLKDQKEAAAAAAKAAKAAKTKAAKAKAAKAAALKATLTAARNAEHRMATAFKADAAKWKKRPAFKNPAKCGKLGVAANGRCGSAGTSSGGPKCKWGHCSQWLWCGNGAAYNGPHKEWYATSGCYAKSYWTAKATAWSKQAKVYQQWTSGSYKKGLRSISSKKRYRMEIINQTNQNMTVFWLDYKGAEKRLVTLKDNQKWAVFTYDTHPLVFKGNYNTVLGVWVGHGAGATSVIEIQPAKIVAH